ncbi:MAG: alpha/beta fold hydrolase, partial [Elusimicrobia bacterium]|nr:alpha/beta fold hydrolase [Elusimicrobiota bacterium]
MTLGVLLALSLSAAAAPRPWTLPGDTVTVRTVDGWTLRGVWEKAQPGQPTVVLLHGTGQRKEDWRPMAYALKRAGDGYFALDLRGHGESRVTPTGSTITWHDLRAGRDVNDFEDMSHDVEAAVATMTAAGVPESSIGMMGAEVGGSIGVRYAAIHPKVPFVILLSPALAWREVPIVNAVRAFQGRSTSILMVLSDADKLSSRDTPLLYTFAKLAVGERHAELITVPEERGTRMLARNRGLIGRIVDWIANPITPEPPQLSTAAVAGSTEAVAGSTVTPEDSGPRFGIAPDTGPAPGGGSSAPGAQPPPSDDG